MPETIGLSLRERTTSAMITPLLRAGDRAAARPAITVWASARLINRTADDVTGNGKAKTFAAARLRKNHRVDANQASSIFTSAPPRLRD